jgi:methylthioribose-1-phosphate isomerase
MLINQQHYRSIWLAETSAFVSQTVFIIDQTMLPHDFNIKKIHNLDEMIVAIKTMQVRGAPLIGAAAAFGLALATLNATNIYFLQESAKKLIESRPTAINLAWAVQRMLNHLATVEESGRTVAAFQEAQAIADEDVQCNLQIAAHGLGLIKTFKENLADSTRTINILTHCNAGWLATVDIGTALGPIYAAHDAGLNVHVWVDETRPRNQGASLTAWELGQHGVPHTIISDNAGGHLMQHGHVDMVIVGADRITQTGDVCNKIGTYLKALSAADHQIPFYVAAPSSTIDWTLSDGLKEIPIEYRDGDELRFMQGIDSTGQLSTVRIMPSGSATLNPAFDVTPSRLVTAVITEQGVMKPDALRLK